ncbi:MAG: lactate utilization protein [Gemmatimonadetes bacterium]|nr:lactate utilization protein [Gemmatimonadota bacterium]
MSRPSPFRARAAENLALHERHRLFDAAAWRARMKREHAAAACEGWEALRERAAAIKAHTLDHLDLYLERFVERAQAAGATVHFAETGQDVNRSVFEICRRRAVRKIVKSKSMTTEECGLNAHLERQGIEVVDTDLGERIVQLFGEPPSHIVAPALHRSTREIAALFARTLGSPPDETDPERLTAYVRRDLRRHFLAADLGMTGANFAVAETGTLVVVENEANSLLSTSLPRIHVAVLGIEKVIPGLAELGVFLRLLARSATGQPMSVYTTHYTGPQARAGGEAASEPRELHVVLVDAGRSALLADPEHRRALACIRCGACLNVCPVYRRAGGHAYGWTYSGPIGSVLAPTMEPPGSGTTPPEELPFASSLCGACTEICPVKIDLHHQLLFWRRRLVESGRKPGPRIAWLAPVLSSPLLFRVAAVLGRRLWPLFRFAAGAWLAAADGAPRRHIPVPAARSFREWWRQR